MTKTKNLKSKLGGGLGLLILAIVLGGSLTLGAMIQLDVIQLPGLSVLPGFEGLHQGIEGLEIGGRFYPLNTALPPGYRWIDSSPASTLIGADLDSWDTEGQIRAEVSTPQLTQDPFTTPQKVDYWVQDGSSYVHVTGEIVAYTANIGISSRDAGAIANSHTYRGERIWIGLTDITWDKAIQEQSVTGKTIMGQAWEAPIQATITDYTQSNLGNHYYLDPSQIGRTLTLYTTAQESGTISQLLGGPGVNSTLAGDLRPDSRLSRQAYFPITLTDYGSTQYVFSSNNPSTTITLRIYALKLGKFTYTNPEDTPWTTRTGELDTTGQNFNALASWLVGLSSNPLFWVGVVASVVAVIFVIFMLSGGMLLLFSRR